MTISANSISSTHANVLKVAHVASGDLWAGAEVQLFTLALQLQLLPDIELHIYLLNYGQLYERLADAGITVSIFNESELSTLGIGIRLYQTLQKLRPDVVHTHRLKENILGSLVARLLRNTPSIRTVHGAPEHQHGLFKPHKTLQSYLDYLCGRYLQKSIVAVSEDLAEQLCTTFPASKISTILNGIDSKAIESVAAKQVSIDLSNDTEVKICFAGRLAPVKRLDLWLETAATLKNNGDYRFSFYVIGDGPEKKQLTVLADRLKLADCVHFLGEQKNVPAWLKQMDILLLTSDHEGLPMVILEALCVKTLVVSHRVGGLAALLDDGKAGYLVTRHDCKGYAEQVLRSLKQPYEAKEKTEMGFTRVTTVYAARACSEKYAAKYAELSRQRNVEYVSPRNTNK